MQDFYQEVANPLLTAVTFEYPSNVVEEVSQDNFRLLFKGSEIVVAGKLRDQSPDVLSAKVRGQLVSGASRSAGEGPLGRQSEGLGSKPSPAGLQQLTLRKSRGALCRLEVTLSSQPVLLLVLRAPGAWNALLSSHRASEVAIGQWRLLPFHR